MYKAILRIHLRDEDKSDGLLERIGDIGFEHGAESDGSNLAYVITNDEEEALIEHVDSFKQAMWKFFDNCETMSLVTAKYGTEGAAEDGEEEPT